MKVDFFGAQEHTENVEFESSALDIGITSEDYSFSSDIRVVCRIFRDGDIARMDGEVYAPLIMQCARCLGKFNKEVTGEFSLVSKRLGEGVSLPEYTDKDNEESEDNLLIIEHDTRTVDITDLVRDALMLSLPVKPVCSEDCKGLCPVCGYNINEGDCGCRSEIHDSRWHGLSGLFEK
ncbi:DUF177 domain-containing protein [Candidatus Latescibacterota bacterium]